MFNESILSFFFDHLYGIFLNKKFNNSKSIKDINVKINHTLVQNKPNGLKFWTVFLGESMK